MKHAHILAALCAIAALSACERNGAGYPRLLPTDQLLAEPALPAHATETGPRAAPTEALETRADALRRRADGLRRPVIDPASRARMDSATGT